MVTAQVDQLEQTVKKAEKELEPSKLRKVFSALPGMVSIVPCGYHRVDLLLIMLSVHIQLAMHNYYSLLVLVCLSLCP